MRRASDIDFESLYRRFNHREFIHPDPLEFVLRYDDPRQQEVVGLIASSFALGRVQSILGVIESILEPLGDPVRTLYDRTPADLSQMFAGFVYRFYRREHLVALLAAIGRMLRTRGSLEQVFGRRLSARCSLQDSLASFVAELKTEATDEIKMLPDPTRGSTCKRLHLYLRWMVRRDAVDPGPWSRLSPADLMVPVDVHMHRIALEAGITQRKTADMKTCDEITGFFRAIRPDDPVRYDFALTRGGIHPDLSYEAVLSPFGETKPKKIDIF